MEAWQQRVGEKKRDEASLLKNIKACAKTLRSLADGFAGDYEDPVYRFYHQSFKVYWLQECTREIVKHLQALAPHLKLNSWFMNIVDQGTGKEFRPEDNANWLAVTRPILEAYFHARYFLEMACKYGRELKSPPEILPSGWAAVLYLFNLR